MTFVVISFYTEGTPYEKEAGRLRDSCRRFGIQPHIVALPSRGSWLKNCSRKSSFIRDQLDRLNTPVLWIDADGEIVGPLGFFEQTGFDFACYVRWPEGKEPAGDVDRRDQPFMSGTVFVNSTPIGRTLVALWADYCESNPTVWDQVCLSWAWRDLRKQIRFCPLPQGYCRVVDATLRESNEAMFITHHQASRRLKDLVENETTTFKEGEVQ